MTVVVLSYQTRYDAVFCMTEIKNILPAILSRGRFTGRQRNRRNHSKRVEKVNSFAIDDSELPSTQSGGG